MHRWILFLFLTSCQFSPPNHLPDVGIPCDWHREANEEEVDPYLPFWEEFGDPILTTLVEEALAYNKDILIAILRVCEFQAQVGIVQSALFPQIQANGLGARQQASFALTPVTPGIPRINSDFQAFLNGSWEIDLWGKIRSQTDAAIARMVSECYVQAGVRLTVISATANAYLFLRQLDKQLKIAQDTLASRIQSLELAKLRFEAGLTSELEVMQAASEKDAAVASVIRLEALIPLQENLLSILVGQNPTDIIRGRSLDTLLIPKAIPAGLPSELLCRRPDILQAEWTLYATNSDIGEAKALFFPSISLTGFFGYESQQLENLFTPLAEAWQYATSLGEPLFTGGRLTSNLRRTEIIRSQALVNYARVVQNAFREVEDALISHRKALELEVILRERVEVLHQYLRLANLQYDNGQTDYLSVLDAERQLFAAELDHADSQGAIFRTVVNLYKALGGGWEDESPCLSRKA